MKWARPKPPKNPGQAKSPVPVTAEFKKYIKQIDCKDISSLHKLGFSELLICKRKKDWDIISAFNKKDRLNYESFIGGFLYYFENHSSSIKNDDRTLFFDWGNMNPKAALTIFLKPLYKPYYHENGKEIKNTGSGKDTGSWTSTQTKSTQSPLAPPPQGGQTDPPKPPSPPPPPRSFELNL